MNNKNKILVGCLALLLVLSVGYAIFSDTITINGTATAKGNFDIEVTCTPGISEELLNETNEPVYVGYMPKFVYDGTTYDNVNDLLENYPENGYENDSCVVNGNSVTYNVGLTTPGARRYFTVKIKNTGSIPAILSNFNTMGDLSVSGTVTLSDGTVSDINEVMQSTGVKEDLADGTGAQFHLTDFNGADLIFYTNDYAYLVLDGTFPTDLTMISNVYQYTSVDFTMTNEFVLPFEQITG